MPCFAHTGWSIAVRWLLNLAAPAVPLLRTSLATVCTPSSPAPGIYGLAFWYGGQLVGRGENTFEEVLKVRALVRGKELLVEFARSKRVDAGGCGAA